MTDTTESIEDKYLGMLMALTPGERMAMACRMFGTARALVVAGIRRTNPQITDTELRREIFLRFYGDDFTQEETERILASIAKAGN